MLGGDFTLLMLAAGAGAGAVTAAIVPGLWLLQVIVAVAVAALLLAVLRPTLLRRVREAPGYRSSLDKLVGSEGVATSEITDGHGQVKVDGEEWSARALEPGSTIAVGERIEVYEVDGATLVVYPVFGILGS
jgi:nodulation efficiency protein D